MVKNCGVEQFPSQVKCTNSTKEATPSEQPSVIYGLGNCTLWNKTKGIYFSMHNLLLPSLVYWWNSDFYLLKMLCRDYFTVNSCHENSNEFSSVTMVNVYFLLKEMIGEWGLLKPLVVVRTTHMAQEFENPKWNNELIWTECQLWGSRCSRTPSRWPSLPAKLWYVFWYLS